MAQTSADPIRILLVAVPRLLGDLVRRARDPDMLVVGEQTISDELVVAVDALAATVVVFGSEVEELPVSCRALLELRPAVKIIVISGDGRAATLYELRRRHERVEDVSADQVVAKVRSAMAISAAAW